MPRSVFVPCCASVLAFFLPTALHGQDDPTVSDVRREAVSLFHDVATNWQKLENYDVVIVEKRQPTGDAPEFLARTRMIADHERGQYLFVGIGAYENSKDHGAAFYLNSEDGEAWIRRSLDEPAMQVSKQATRNSGLSICSFPDVRLVGALTYPARFIETPIDEYFATDFGFANDVKIEVIGEGNLDVVATNLPGKDSRLQRRYTFENDRPVPTHLLFTLGMRDGTRQYVENDESISWKEISGVFLPNKIQGISRTHREAKPKNFAVTFEWSVVNDSDKLPRFGVDILSDEQRLWELVPKD